MSFPLTIFGSQSQLVFNQEGEIIGFPDEPLDIFGGDVSIGQVEIPFDLLLEANAELLQAATEEDFQRQLAALRQEAINRELEREIEEERAAEPTGVFTGEEGPVQRFPIPLLPQGFPFPEIGVQFPGTPFPPQEVLGLPERSTPPIATQFPGTGPFTREQIEAIAEATGQSVSTVLETETVVEDPPGSGPQVPAEEAPEEPCRFDPNLILQLALRLGLEFPLNFQAFVNLLRAGSFSFPPRTVRPTGDPVGEPVLAGDPAQCASLFQLTQPQPKCCCACQVPQRSCCGSCATGGCCESE